MPNPQAHEPGSWRARLVAMLAVGLVGLASVPSTGYAASTPTLVRDINESPSSGSPHDFVEFDGTAFFASSTGLWKSDGTESGTELVK